MLFSWCPELKNWLLTIFALNSLDWYIGAGRLHGKCLELKTERIISVFKAKV